MTSTVEPDIEKLSSYVNLFKRRKNTGPKHPHGLNASQIWNSAMTFLSSDKLQNWKAIKYDKVWNENILTEFFPKITAYLE